MWKTSVSPPQNGACQSTGRCGKLGACPQGDNPTCFGRFIHRKIFAFHVDMWKKIGAEKCPHGAQREELMLDVISRTADCRGRGVLQAHFHLADGVNDGGVISSKFRPISGRERLVNWRIRYMATCRASAVPLFFEGAAQDGFVNGIEPANLADDEGRGGNGVSLHLEHIVDGRETLGRSRGMSFKSR